MADTTIEPSRLGLPHSPPIAALPKIPIPLKREHADAVIDLQSLLNERYDAAGYADYIYAGQPRPALSPENLKWTQQSLGNWSHEGTF